MLLSSASANHNDLACFYLWHHTDAHCDGSWIQFPALGSHRYYWRNANGELNRSLLRADVLLSDPKLGVNFSPPRKIEHQKFFRERHQAQRVVSPHWETVR